MSKIQTRRAISLEFKLHALVDERTAVLGVSKSQYISDLIRADLATVGIIAPPGRHGLTFTRNHAARVKALRESRARKDALDPKVTAALEHTRRQMVEQKPAKQPRPKATCWWCGDDFHSGEIPSNWEGNEVHGRCKREMSRLPGGVPAR